VPESAKYARVCCSYGAKAEFEAIRVGFALFLRWIKNPAPQRCQHTMMHMARIIGILGVATVVWSALAAAADFDAGCSAYDRGDFAAALEEWQPLAEQGHAQAQFRLGCLHAFGLGVPQDHEQARTLFLRAAEQGDADAQNNLGGMYALGWGVPVDFVEAYMWFDLAAANGLEIAARNRAFVAESMTAEELGLAQQRTRDWAAAHR
jgi:TPR repeat protein